MLIWFRWRKRKKCRFSFMLARNNSQSLASRRQSLELRVSTRRDLHFQQSMSSGILRACWRSGWSQWLRLWHWTFGCGCRTRCGSPRPLIQRFPPGSANESPPVSVTTATIRSPSGPRVYPSTRAISQVSPGARQSKCTLPPGWPPIMFSIMRVPHP